MCVNEEWVDVIVLGSWSFNPTTSQYAPKMLQVQVQVTSWAISTSLLL
jgi:hypothetical protein